MSSKIMEYISPAERSAAMLAGAYIKFAEAGVRLGDIDGMVKRALELPSANGVAKSVIALSVIAGVPIGIASHLIGRRISKERGEERELTTEAGYYRNAAHQLERGMLGLQAAS
jgi:hypothetical protein